MPPLARALTVEAKPQADKLEPGGSTQLDVVVKDATGNPVPNAELAVAVVDEAILALTGYDIPDPLTTIYTERPTDMTDSHNRGFIVLANPMALAPEARGAADNALGGAPAMAAAPAPAAEAPRAMATQSVEKAVGESTSGQANTPITVRTDFNPLANWSPAVSTDAQGRASITIKVPDNLTRYRVMVVAVAGGKQFGKGASAVTARLPLMVRPSAPRFLNFGDRFELPVVVQNQTEAPMTVDVALRVANLQLTQGEGRRVTVPANDRVEVRFPATTVSSGHGPVPGGCCIGQVGRRGEHQPACVYAGDNRGVCGLRCARRGQHRPARDRADRRLHAVRRAGDPDILDRTSVAHRCIPLPGGVPVRVLGAASVAHPLGVRAARRADGVPGPGPAVCRRKSRPR